MGKLYIILPVFNRLDLTIKFVESLKKQTYTNYTLLLIDDGSTDGTSNKVKQLLENTIVIEGKGNWWWAGSLQKAYDWINNDGLRNSFTLIINDDLVFEDNFLEKGITYLIKNDNTFVLSAAYNENEPHNLEDCGIVYDFKNNTFIANDVTNLDKLNCVSTRGLFMKTTDFIKTNGFRPFLLPHYYSDYEFSIRAKRKFSIELRCFLDLKVFINTTSTGIEVQSFNNLSDYFGKAFSKRNKANPVYSFIYYLISFPYPYNFKYSFMEVKQFYRVMRSLIFKNI